MARFGERIDALTLAVRDLQMSLTTQGAQFVTRSEWLMRNETVDREFKSKGAEIGELRTELRSHRLPWTSVAGTVVAVAALALSIITQMGT